MGVPQHGDLVPTSLRQELVEMIAEEKAIIADIVLAQARDYGMSHLRMVDPDVDEIWR